MNDKPIKEQIKQSMDAITDSIDVSTQVKLNEARHAAINQPGKFNTLRWALMGSTLATVLAVAFFINQSHGTLDINNRSILFEDLELLSNDESTDFYEDLDFLAWLEASDWTESEI